MNIPFDKIYCIHLAESQDRYTNCIKEFNRLGISDKVSFWWSSKKPINNYISRGFPWLHSDYYDAIQKEKNPEVYGNLFDCTYNHYSIINQAYIRGFNSILILEDDIKFNDDLNIVKNVFDTIPNDYSIIKFHNLYVRDHVSLTKNPQIEGLSYIEPKYINCYNEYFNSYKYSLMCYGINRKGMELLLDEYNKLFRPSDEIMETVKSKNIPDFYLLESNMLINQIHCPSIICNVNYNC